MKGPRVAFPLVVGLTIAATDSLLSENLLITLADVFRRLRERASSGVLVIHCESAPLAEKIAAAAGQAGVACRTAFAGPSRESPEPRTGGLTTANVALVEVSDVILMIAPIAEDSGENELARYAERLGRPLLRIPAQSAPREHDIPSHFPHQGGWLAELFDKAGLSFDADLETIKSRMSAMADRAAPVTRVWWNWITFLQGLAVCAPLAWLVQRSLGLPIEIVAAATIFTVLLLIAVSWWLRWRSMQKTWARARLIAEAARSLVATATCPRVPAWTTFGTVPSLRLLSWIAPDSKRRGAAGWRESYVTNRIDDQEKYFGSRQVEAEKRRKLFSRWATVLLDVGLAFASAGAVLALIPRGREWLGMLGDARLTIVLGAAGVLMPLGLLLIQVLRGVHDLNRRTARFAQQRKMLEEARARLASSLSDDAAMEVVDDTERQLLAEVLEWYFQAETAEHFFNAPAQRNEAVRFNAEKAAPPLAAKVGWRILGMTGLAGLFLLRVVLGRLPWVVGSAAAALAWIAYNNPTQHKDDVGSLATLSSRSNGRDEQWAPTPQQTEQGCVIIVHGLHGGVTATGSAQSWMKDLADAINTRLGSNAPSICLVDWKDAAQPALFNRLSLGLGAEADFIGDIASIRPQAQEVGRLLAFRVAEMIVEEKTIRRDRPLHLIGHSAGGFVVTRVAVLLKSLGIAPEPLHVTILDTPAPDAELLEKMPSLYPKEAVDFYVTSDLGGRKADLTFADFSTLNIHMKKLSAPAKAGAKWWNTAGDAHRWSCVWFIRTITEPGSGHGEGFDRSPFAAKLAADRQP